LTDNGIIGLLILCRFFIERRALTLKPLMLQIAA
jgi:hypothetical protein